MTDSVPRTSSPSSERGPTFPSVGQRGSLLGLARDLDRWGCLFLEVARTKDASAIDRVLGGLVEWMGSDLVDGWVRLPIPVFEQVSELAEELFRACAAYLGWVKRAPRAIAVEERKPHEDRIRSTLVRVRDLAGQRREMGPPDPLRRLGERTSRGYSSAHQAVGLGQRQDRSLCVHSSRVRHR